MTESEVLEKQNVEMKDQLRDLESQRVKLTEMLKLHRLECVNQHLISKSRTFEDFKLNPSSYNQKIRQDKNNNETRSDNKCNVINNQQVLQQSSNPIDEHLPSFMNYKFLSDDTTSSHNIFDFGVEMFNSEEDDFQKQQDQEWEIKYSHTLQNNSNNGMHSSMMSQNLNMYQPNLNGAPHLSHVQIKNEHDQQTLHEVKC